MASVVDPSGIYTGSGAIQNLHNAMDCGIECTHSNSGVDTKLSSFVEIREGQDVIWRDWHKLKKGAHRNLMWFNSTKWKVLHLDKEKPTMNRLRAAQEKERDLWVLVDERLDKSQQCVFATQKNNHVVGCIQRSAASRAREQILLYQLWGH